MVKGQITEYQSMMANPPPNAHGGKSGLAYPCTCARCCLHPISYDIYLNHLPIVVALQLAAIYLPLPVGGLTYE